MPPAPSSVSFPRALTIVLSTPFPVRVRPRLPRPMILVDAVAGRQRHGGLDRRLVDEIDERIPPRGDVGGDRYRRRKIAAGKRDGLRPGADGARIVAGRGCDNRAGRCCDADPAPALADRIERVGVRVVVRDPGQELPRGGGPSKVLGNERRGRAVERADRLADADLLKVVVQHVVAVAAPAGVGVDEERLMLKVDRLSCVDRPVHWLLRDVFSPPAEGIPGSAQVGLVRLLVVMVHLLLRQHVLAVLVGDREQRAVPRQGLLGSGRDRHHVAIKVAHRAFVHIDAVVGGFARRIETCPIDQSPRQDFLGSGVSHGALLFQRSLRCASEVPITAGPSVLEER